MKNTISFESSYGHFDYKISAEIGEDVNAETVWLARQGLANLAYRVCGSSVDKALGVKDRKAVEFSEETSEQINAAVSKKITELEGKDGEKGLPKSLRVSFQITGKHEFGAADSGATKEATEVWTKLQGEKDAEKFAAILAKLGLDVDYTDEQAIVAVARALRDARRAAAEAAKGALLGL